MWVIHFQGACHPHPDFLSPPGPPKLLAQAASRAAEVCRTGTVPARPARLPAPHRQLRQESSSQAGNSDTGEGTGTGEQCFPDTKATSTKAGKSLNSLYKTATSKNLTDVQKLLG